MSDSLLVLRSANRAAGGKDSLVTLILAARVWAVIYGDDDLLGQRGAERHHAAPPRADRKERGVLDSMWGFVPAGRS